MLKAFTSAAMMIFALTSAALAQETHPINGKGPIVVTDYRPENPIVCDAQKGLQTQNYLNVLRQYVELDALGAILYPETSYVLNGETVVLKGYVYGLTCERVDSSGPSQLPINMPADTKFAWTFHSLKDFNHVETNLVVPIRHKADRSFSIRPADGMNFVLEIPVDRFFSKADAEIVKAGQGLVGKKMTVEFLVSSSLLPAPARTFIQYTYDVLPVQGEQARVIVKPAP